MIFNLWVTLVTLAVGLRFDILATQGQGTVRCFEQYVLAHNTVTGKIEVPAKPFQTVDFLVFYTHKITDDAQEQNRHYSKLNVDGSQKFSFTTHQSANIRYCFTSTLMAGHQPGPDMKRSVFLHVETELQNTDPHKELKGRFQALETEIRWLTQTLDEAQLEMSTYEHDDDDMYALNEMTKSRVFNYSGLSFLVLVGLTAWQVYYLHSFFKQKVFGFNVASYLVNILFYRPLL